jgi:hypothetical protein
MDVVLIPAYYRPEYLSLCLEFLSKAAGARLDKEYWICQDYRNHDEHRYAIQERWTKEVVEASPLPVKFIRRRPHDSAGNSLNTLEAYKEAYDTGARNIYLVEEDVLVTKDFFSWHEAVQAQEPAVMCSVAYRCSRNADARKDIVDSGAYFVSARDYASIGVCWNRAGLGPVLSHARWEYYVDQSGYIMRTFPANRFAGDFSEQDGLIMRVMWEQRGNVAWPYVPRCYHLGWYGYHRPNGKRPDGQLATKVAQIRSLICEPIRLRAVSPDFGDIEPYDDTLNVPFSKLERMEYFA